MSKFKTAIPVDVQSIRRLLPEGSYVHGVTFDASTDEVLLIWEHDKFVSGRDFPVPFPTGSLQEQALPTGITLFKPRSVTPAPVPGLPEQGDRAPLENLPSGELTEAEAETRLYEAGAKLAADGKPLPSDVHEAVGRGYADYVQNKAAASAANPSATESNPPPTGGEATGEATNPPAATEENPPAGDSGSAASGVPTTPPKPVAKPKRAR